MNQQVVSKITLIVLLAFFASAGACYPPTRTESGEQIKAAEIFTRYRIEEYIRSDDGKCRRRITTQFSGNNKIYLLQPPARATYNGTEIKSRSGENYAEFGGDGDRAEFVLIDKQGAKKTDVYELNKAKLNLPSSIDRAEDLRIPIEFGAECDYDLSGTIETDEPGEPVFFRFFPAKNETDLAARLNDPGMPKNQAYFLPVEKLLVIPKTILAALPAGDSRIGIGVEQRLFKPRSENPANSVRSEALVYKYGFDFNVKFK